jgi:hypothetical protein
MGSPMGLVWSRGRRKRRRRRRKSVWTRKGALKRRVVKGMGMELLTRARERDMAETAQL